MTWFFESSAVSAAMSASRIADSAALVPSIETSNVRIAEMRRFSVFPKEPRRVDTIETALSRNAMALDAREEVDTLRVEIPMPSAVAFTPLTVRVLFEPAFAPT